MCDIGKKTAPIHIIVHYPETGEGRRELARRVAGVHADMVTRYIRNLNCPSAQKAELLDSVIESARNMEET